MPILDVEDESALITGLQQRLAEHVWGDELNARSSDRDVQACARGCTIDGPFRPRLPEILRVAGYRLHVPLP